MVLMFEWVLKFRIWVLTVILGTYVYGILVIDGYLCSRVYGIGKEKRGGELAWHYTKLYHTSSTKPTSELMYVDR